MNQQNKQINLMISILQSQFFPEPFVVTANKSKSINQLKKQISQVTNIPCSVQMLKFKDKFLLEQEHILQNLGISQLNNQIDVVIFGDKNFGFNDMKTQQTLLATKGKPSHRSIKAGAIFQAICKNDKCKVFGQKCCINKQMGTFEVGKQINRCVCPICREKTKKAFRFYYYKCKVNINGVKSNEQQFSYKGEAKGGEVKTFIHNDKSMAQWDYIQIVTTSL